MIDRTQLAEALARLDPRDREVLDYSLRRHVPDEDLAAVFDCGPGEVARMRARAVERLADDLGVQRGADLGHVLTALLDQSTWGAAETVLRPERERPAEPPAEPAEPPAEPAESPAETAEPPAETAQPPRAPEQPAEPAPSSTPVAPAGAPSARRKEPVLGMLGDREPERIDATAPGAKTPGDEGRRWWAVASVLIVVLVGVGLGSVLLLGNDASSTPGAGEQDVGTRPFEAAESPLGDPFPSDPDSANRYPVATVDGPVQVHDAPGGRRTLRIAPKTEWDSPRVLGIVERRGQWLAVLLPELDNGEVGWIHEDDVARLDSVGWAIKANLARRTLVVERDGEVVRELPIGVGREDHPTPTGRFAVTDKLRVNDPNSPYGCCVLALTGHQTRLPVGWPGGDRLAIHATPDLSGLGEAVSLGCLRADPEDARWMMEEVPLGTPVFIAAGATRPDGEGRTSRGAT